MLNIIKNTARLLCCAVFFRRKLEFGGLCLVLKGFAVSALFLGRILLMCSYFDSLQGAIIYAFCMVSAVIDGALDTFIFSVY